MIRFTARRNCVKDSTAHDGEVFWGYSNPTLNAPAAVAGGAKSRPQQITIRMADWRLDRPLLFSDISSDVRSQYGQRVPAFNRSASREKKEEP